ncbi:MAG: B12-binding domain-containing radical SAM protein [Kiloniellales bacterium]
MRNARSADKRTFYVELIKSSHYDPDGYVLQWWKSWIPSNSLACLYGLAQRLAEQQVLGEDVEIVIEGYDEMNTAIPFKRIVKRIKDNDGRGLVCLTGVQSNQYPRALDIARQFRQHGIQVAIGGFHVSGCLSMLPGIHESLQEALDMGISLFAGEAELRLDEVLRDAYRGELKPIYNYLTDLPDLQGAVTPFLPERMVRRYDGVLGSFDAGRGCPFQCSFCTIINVQGRKSRYRSADDIEAIIRTNAAQGVNHFFITDDNFARNRNWEAIFDRMGDLREHEGFPIRFLIQVDTLCHKIPGFVDKAARAGCSHVFIGLENINPDNLVAMKKNQNRITEYRTMFQQWRAHNIVTYAGYIIGLPNDTHASIMHDIEIIQREIPVDLLEFTILTPLPGSEDHQKMYKAGEWMDPDLNKYDLEHVTIHHARLSGEELQQTYWDAWDHYYSREHVKTLMRRAVADGTKPVRIWQNVLQIHGAMHYEGVHPQQCGYGRRKLRSQRRYGLPRENPLLFYPQRVWETLSTYARFGWYAWRLDRLRKRIQRDPASKSYSDLALSPVEVAEEEELEMFHLNQSAEAAVAKAKAQAEARAQHQSKRAGAGAAA